MRIIIDISELAGWTGKLTGVPRVMNELALRYDIQDNAILVKWDGLSRSFIKTELASYDDAPTEELPLTPHNPAYKRVARRVVYGTAVSGKIARKIKSRKLAKSSGLAISNEVVVPVKGDTLFVLADWHGGDQTFVDALVQAKSTGVKLVQASYDLLPVVTPQYSGHSTDTFRNYVRNIYPICDLILAISEHTKKDIHKWLKKEGLSVPEIEVFRLGDDFERSEARKPSGVSSNHSYILCVGTIEARKNHAILYYAYKLAVQRGVTLPKLIVVGRRGWKSEDIYDIIKTDPETKDLFVFMEHCSDEELAWLYQNCLFTVYPSFYEGWGLPIAESIAYGAPCIASNTSSMPEVAGDLIEYCSPASSDEFFAAITSLLEKSNLTTARNKITEYQPTSWDETFEQVKHYIEKVKQ